MDYHYNNTAVDTNLIPFHHQLQHQHHQHHHHPQQQHQQQQQQQSFPYNNNNQFQRQTDTLHILTSPTEDMFNRSQQWNSPSDMMDLSNNNNNEELNQPERGIAGFVSKLYQCLQAPDDGQKYARWCRHNGIDMFIIDCIPKFTEIVLPRLFKHCKFASFVRQLNIYGFQRDTDARKSKDSKDKETCRWHHTHFRPGHRDLFHLIRRKTPRYSRRKRPKTEEEDPETILNVGSGDESDNNHIIEDEDTNSSLDERRRSASSTSSSITLHHHHLKQQQQQQQQQQYHQAANNNHPTISTDYKHRQLHMIFEISQENNDYLQVQPSSTSPSSSSPPYCHFPTTNNRHIIPLPTTADGSEVDTNENDPHDLLLLQQTMTQDEEQLRSHIIQLRRGYLRMYKILTGEVNKAFNLIDVQRSRIEFLENTLRNNQQQQIGMRQHDSTPFVDTYFPNSSAEYGSSILQHHSTAPTTPIYPNHTQQQDNFVQQSPLNTRVQNNYDFLFNNNQELSSPCSSVVPEKWIPTPPAFQNHHHTQISGLSSAGIPTTTTDA